MNAPALIVVERLGRYQYGGASIFIKSRVERLCMTFLNSLYSSTLLNGAGKLAYVCGLPPVGG